jgi:hypothetical protein
MRNVLHLCDWSYLALFCFVFAFILSPLCDVCAPDYYHAHDTGECTPCGIPGGAKATVGLSVGLFFGTLAVAIWYAVKKGVAGAEELVNKLETHVIANAADAADALDNGTTTEKLFSADVVSDVAKKAEELVQEQLDEQTGGGDELMVDGLCNIVDNVDGIRQASLKKDADMAKAAWTRPSIVAKARGALKILVTMYQIVSQLPNVLHIEFPFSFRTFLDRISFARCVLRPKVAVTVRYGISHLPTTGQSRFYSIFAAGLRTARGLFRRAAGYDGMQQFHVQQMTDDE